MNKKENNEPTTINEAMAKNNEDHRFFSKMLLASGFYFVILFVCLSIGMYRIKQNTKAIEEMNEPVVVATVNVNDKLLMTIAKMEQDIDMLKIRMEEYQCKLDSATNFNSKQEVLQ